MNRGNAKARVFHDREDYARFRNLIDRASQRVRMRILALCLMPNHFHLVVWPFGDGDLSRWMQWVLTTHVRRHHMRYETTGRVWQGRFKAFPIQQDEHLLTVLRYVERNPLRAGLVSDAEDWEWSSLGSRISGRFKKPLTAGPVPQIVDWLRFVNEPQTAAELAALRLCSSRELPYGNEGWVASPAARLGFDARTRGRPRMT